MSALPAGWGLAPLLSVSTVPGRKGHAVNPLPVLTFAGLHEGGTIEFEEPVSPQAAIEKSMVRGEPGDVVFTKQGHVQGWIAKKVGLLREAAFTASTLQVLRPDHERVAPSYLRWWLGSEETYRRIADLAGARTSLHRPVLDALFVPLPPLAEQWRIVEALDEQFPRLDAGIAWLHRAQRNLSRMRAAILSAAVEGRLVDSEEEWNVESLGELLAHGPQNGIYKPASAYGVGTSILRIDDFQDGWLRRRSELRSLILTEPEAETYALQPGDLVINRVNSMSHLGKCVVVPPTLCPAVFESNMMRMRFRAEVLPKWIEIVLRSPAGRAALTQNAKQAVNQASINQQDVKQTPIPHPPVDEQERIIAEVDRQFSILDAMDATVKTGLARAERLRQSILCEAFAGRLVPQDPDDEPASALVERITSERTIA